MFALQTIPVPGLAALGVVELHELSYGQLRDAMGQAPGRQLAAEALLAASLVINGQAVGTLDGLRALPGRFAGAISVALMLCLKLHGMAGEDDDGEENEAGEPVEPAGDPGGNP